jgi:uncharacterized protein YyaL (SSP411 family)
MSSQKPEPNRLIHESSPYLQQHAYNPVDWHPWGDEALALARNTDRLLLVSIGYSACHWCHVMERESFEDKEVAELMNEHFVCIKVDREERPDVDKLYMEAVQLITGQGGWPLNCFALPDGRPIWGGTYFRKQQWTHILKQFARLWSLKDPALLNQADNVLNGLHQRQSLSIVQDDYEANSIFLKMASNMLRHCDVRYGGQKGTPKFPMPDLLLFQWLLAVQMPEPALRKHVLLTLDRMVCGGIFDQLEGGFARYSVDERWHIPHFEKMLYDNAQLIGLYSEVSRSSGHKDFEMATRMTIDWCISNLFIPGEMFCSALDADSEGKEGSYYVWTQQEFNRLPADIALLMSDWFGIGGQASWENGTNVLVRPYTLEAFCQKHQLEKAQWQTMLKQGVSQLLSWRNKRSRPQLDDKQLLVWNALMIKGLCSAYKAFGECKWLEIARNVESFIRNTMTTEHGELLHSYKNNLARIPAFLDDYAFYIQALISLYQCTFDETYLFDARKLTYYAIDNFYLNQEGIFNYTSHNSKDLVLKPREIDDNVIPSSNAAMCLAMIALGIYFEDAYFMKEARTMLRNQASLMERYPAAYSHWAQALWLMEHQDLTVFRGEKATEYATSKLADFHHLHLIAASNRQSGIPVVASKVLNDGLWQWNCNHQGCGIPIKIDDSENILYQQNS